VAGVRHARGAVIGRYDPCVHPSTARPAPQKEDDRRLTVRWLRHRPLLDVA
jgi:hypothetical protein